MSSMQNGRSSVIILCLWKYRTQYLKSVKDFPVTQMAKNLPAMQETQVQSLGGEDPLENRMATCKYKWYSCLENSMDREVWQTTVHGFSKKLDMTKRLTHIL